MRLRSSQRGWALIPVLVMLSLSAVVLRSVIGAATAERRMERDAEERRLVREMMAYGFARLETELRQREERGDAVRFELDLPAPPRLRVPKHWLLFGSVRPADPETWIEVPARHPDDGRPTVIEVPQRYLGDLDETELLARVRSAVRDAGGAHSRADWLWSLLVELRKVAHGESWDRLWAEIDGRLERAIVEGSFTLADRRTFAETVARLDPIPRLYGHVRHSRRVSGVDRRAFVDPGPAIAAGRSGRFRLTVELQRSDRPSDVESREVTLSQRQWWISEEDFTAPAPGSLSGWEFDARRGGTRLGPEAASEEARPWRPISERSTSEWSHTGDEVAGGGPPVLPGASVAEAMIAGSDSGPAGSYAIRWTDLSPANVEHISWTGVGGRLVRGEQLEWWSAGERVAGGALTDRPAVSDSRDHRWRPSLFGGGVTLTSDEMVFEFGDADRTSRRLPASGAHEAWTRDGKWIVLEERRVRLFDRVGSELGRADFPERLCAAFLDRSDCRLLVASTTGWWAVDWSRSDDLDRATDLEVRPIPGPSLPPE
ncbi:MAG: hypothetical protein AAF488_08505, partial [Planctomycetota bacterium]